MTDLLRDRRAAEVVHDRYWGLLTEGDALGALAACGAPAGPGWLHAALEAYDGFSHRLRAILDPAVATGAGELRRRDHPPLTQTPPPGRRFGHVF